MLCKRPSTACWRFHSVLALAVGLLLLGHGGVCVGGGRGGRGGGRLRPTPGARPRARAVACGGRCGLACGFRARAMARWRALSAGVRRCSVAESRWLVFGRSTRRRTPSTTRKSTPSSPRPKSSIPRHTHTHTPSTHTLTLASARACTPTPSPTFYLYSLLYLQRSLARAISGNRSNAARSRQHGGRDSSTRCFLVCERCIRTHDKIASLYNDAIYCLAGAGAIRRAC